MTATTAKQTPLPQRAMIRPPRPGPMMRAALLRALLIATPFATSGGSSNSLTIAERVGKSTALARPSSVASTTTCQSCT